jgi:hypothetical protein
MTVMTLHLKTHNVWFLAVARGCYHIIRRFLVITGVICVAFVKLIIPLRAPKVEGDLEPGLVVEQYRISHYNLINLL